MASIGEIVVEEKTLAAAGGSDDPNDRKGDGIPTIEPSIPADVDEENDFEEDDEEPDFGSDEEEELIEAVKHMTLDEKKKLSKRYEKEIDVLNQKQALVRTAVRKEERSMKKAVKEMNKAFDKAAEKEEKKQKRETVITINVNFQDRVYAIQVRGNLGIGSLRSQFFALANIKAKDQKDFRFHFGALDLFETFHARKTINEVGLVDGCSVIASVRGVGGGLRRFVSKTALNPLEAKKVLKEKVAGVFKSEHSSHNENFPNSFKEFVNETKQSVDEIKVWMNRVNAPIIPLAIKQVSTENIKLMINILERSEGKRKGTSEEKLYSVLEVIFPKFALLNECNKCLEALRGEMVIELFNIYIESYGRYISGEMVFNNQLFIKNLQDELVCREMTNNDPLENAPAGCLIVWNCTFAWMP